MLRLPSQQYAISSEVLGEWKVTHWFSTAQGSQCPNPHAVQGSTVISPHPPFCPLGVDSLRIASQNSERCSLVLSHCSCMQQHRGGRFPAGFTLRWKGPLVKSKGTFWAKGVGLKLCDFFFFFQTLNGYSCCSLMARVQAWILCMVLESSPSSHCWSGKGATHP